MTGRPSDFTDEIATRICDLLMDGLSMRSICQADDMPHRTTVVRWLERYPEFASMYAHARTLQADLMDDMILETANACTPATAQADRVKINLTNVSVALKAGAGDDMVIECLYCLGL